MCTYSGETNDPQRHTAENFEGDLLEATVQTLIKVPENEVGKFGLAPFYKSNPAPPVSIIL
jgi:hypothetical protein